MAKKKPKVKAIKPVKAWAAVTRGGVIQPDSVFHDPAYVRSGWGMHTSSNRYRIIPVLISPLPPRKAKRK